MKDHSDKSQNTNWQFKNASDVAMGNSDRLSATIPFASLIATVLSCAGVAIFLFATYRGVTLTLHMIEVVFNFYFTWLGDMYIVFIVFGIVMAVISLSMLTIGFLTTGSTRSKIYKGWKAQLGGKISCGILTCVAYTMNLVWLAFMACLVVIVFVFFLMSEICNNFKKQLNADERCMDFTQFEYFFPNNTALRVCQEGKLKTICKDCVEPGILMFILALAASVLVIISLIHYLMCLSANTARIKDHKESLLQQELEFLQRNEDTPSKSRYHDTSHGIFAEDSFHRTK